MSEDSPEQTDWIAELVRIMAALRAPDGCPWDRQQTHKSLKQYLVEESAELMDAIDEGDDEGMAEELGDVLLQVVFHCRIAEEEGRFGLQDAARRICEKMRRRHPHVFSGGNAEDAEAVLVEWDKIKKAEKGDLPKSAVEGVPRSLPALHRAFKIQKKAAKAGFDWPDIDGVVAKVEEELAEVKDAVERSDDEAVASEIGDLLFAVVNLGRFRGNLAEDLLHDSIRKFERRFQRVESFLAERGEKPEDCPLQELDALWERAKREE